MTARSWLLLLLATTIAACGSPPPPPHPTPAADPEPAGHDAGAPAPPVAAFASAPAEPFTPSTATYEEAMAAPEVLDTNDGRPELTDRQLSEPMQGVLGVCRIPPSVRVTIQTAVQNGHSIGVTVHVELPKPKPEPKPKRGKKRPKRGVDKAAKARAQLVERITKCADHAVRALTWPSSGRRDSFTTTF